MACVALPVEGGKYCIVHEHHPHLHPIEPESESEDETDEELINHYER
jgi:hypothetical protein